MQPIITENLERLRTICAAYPLVKRLYVFGSAVREDFTENSDVDLLVDLIEGDMNKEADLRERYRTIADLRETFEGTFGREVDLLTFEQIKNPYFIQALNRTAQKVYGLQKR